ncbi:hypothetical protein IJT93_07250 [bacterium]|nr:hypothetical protein [bacterium]
METDKDILKNSDTPNDASAKEASRQACEAMPPDAEALRSGREAVQSGCEEARKADGGEILSDSREEPQPGKGEAMPPDSGEAQSNNSLKERTPAGPEAGQTGEKGTASLGGETAEPDKELCGIDWISCILVIICLVNIFYWYSNLEVVPATDNRVFLAHPIENNFKNSDLRSSAHDGALPPAPAPSEESARKGVRILGSDGRLSDGLPHSDDKIIINDDPPGADGKLSDGLPHNDEGAINGEAPYSGVCSDVPGADGRLSDGKPHSGEGVIINDIPGADGRLSDGKPHSDSSASSAIPGEDSYKDGSFINKADISEDVVKSMKRPPGAGE